jgi:hypothetical protein
MKQVDAHGQITLHSTVDMHTVNTQLFTAVCSTFFACPARAAVDIGLNCAPVTNLQSTLIGSNFDNFTRKLMAEHARVGINRMAPREGMEITPTDSNPLHAN